MLWEKVCTNTDTHQQVQTFISLLTFTDTDAWHCPLPTLHPNPHFFDVHEQSWHNTSRHGEPTHRLDKLETSQSIRVSFCLLFLPVWLWSPLMIIKPTGTRHMMLSVSQIWICLLAKSSLNKTEGGGCNCALLLLLTSQERGKNNPTLWNGFSCGYV